MLKRDVSLLWGLFCFLSQLALGASVVPLPGNTVQLSSPSAGKTVNSPVKITATFQSPVQKFNSRHIAVNNGSVSSIQAKDNKGKQFALTVKPTAQGAFSVQIRGKPSKKLNFVFDSTAPTVSLSRLSAENINSAIQVKIAFNEPVTGVQREKIIVTNGAITSLTGSEKNYLLAISPINAGRVSVKLPVGAAQDAAGNMSAASEELTFQFDNSRPSATLSSIMSSPTSTPFSVQVAFNKEVTGFGMNSVVTSQGTVDSFQGSGKNYSFRVVPNSEGSIQVSLRDSGIVDAFGNTGIKSFNTLVFGYDTQSPIPTLSRLSAENINSAIQVKIAFNELVTGVQREKIIVTNGAITSLTGSEKDYLLAISPSNVGRVGVKLPVGAAQDAAGNLSAATEELTFQFDNTPVPSDFFTTSCYTSSAIAVEIIFDKEVVGFGPGSILSSQGRIESVQGSGKRYSFTVVPSTEGAVSIDLLPSGIRDVFGNEARAPQTLRCVYDPRRPQPTLTRLSPEVSRSDFVIGIQFDEPVFPMVPHLVVTNGTVNRMDCIDGHRNCGAKITPTQAGPVTVQVPEGFVQDTVGNANVASAELSFQFDNIPASATLSSTMSSPTSRPIPVQVIFDKDVTGFGMSSLSLSQGTVESFQGSGKNYSFTVLPNSEGPLQVSILGNGVRDSLGNEGIRSSNTLSFMVDRQAPVVTLQSKWQKTNSTGSVSVTFSETVSGFEDRDVIVTNGTVAEMTGDGKNFSLWVTPAASGRVGVKIPQGVSQDTAGNSNAASEEVSFEFDNTKPSVTLSSTVTAPTFDPIPIQVVFDEEVLFSPGLISLSQGRVQGFQGSGRTYSFSVVPQTEGPLEVRLLDNASGERLCDTFNNCGLKASNILSFNIQTGATASLSETGELKIQLDKAGSQATLTQAQGYYRVITDKIASSSFEAAKVRSILVLGNAFSDQTLKIGAGSENVVTHPLRVDPSVESTMILGKISTQGEVTIGSGVIVLAADINSSGTQRFKGKVEVSGNRVLNSGNSNIVFENNVESSLLIFADPDSAPPGTDISNFFPGMQISVVSSDSQVTQPAYALRSSLQTTAGQVYAPTGSQVFGTNCEGCDAFSYEQRLSTGRFIQVDFSQAIRHVSFDFTPLSLESNPVGGPRIWVYSPRADGIPFETQPAQPLQINGKTTATLGVTQLGSARLITRVQTAWENQAPSWIDGLIDNLQATLWEKPVVTLSVLTNGTWTCAGQIGDRLTIATKDGVVTPLRVSHLFQGRWVGTLSVLQEGPAGPIQTPSNLTMILSQRVNEVTGTLEAMGGGLKGVVTGTVSGNDLNASVILSSGPCSGATIKLKITEYEGYGSQLDLGDPGACAPYQPRMTVDRAAGE
jgi:hypothetical protein